MFISAGSRGGRGRRIPRTSAAQIAAALPAGNTEPGQRLNPIISCEFMHQVTPNGDWYLSPVSAGAFVVAASTVPDAAHPGIVTVNSSTTANSGGLISSNTLSILLGGGEQFDCIWKTGAAFTATTTRLGFHDAQSVTDAVDGAYFEISATGVIIGKTSNNSVQTSSATITTLSVSTWYHMRVKLNAAATQVDFTIYNMAGVVLGATSITTNIPTASGRECQPAFISTNSGTVATLLCSLDYISFCYQGRTLVRGALT